jgi:DNA-binding GntR family transcriptional regulator
VHNTLQVDDDSNQLGYRLAIFGNLVRSWEATLAKASSDKKPNRRGGHEAAGSLHRRGGTAMSREAAEQQHSSLSLTETAVNLIRDRVLDLTLAPGQRIDERLLMERFELSRTPAREALNRLAAEGLIEIQSNKGAFVRPLDIRQLKQFFDAYITAERTSGHFCNPWHANLVSDLREVEEEYEIESARHAFLQVTRLNAKFHLRIARATENEYLFTFCSLLHNQGRRISYFIDQVEARHSKQLRMHQEKIKGHHLEIIRVIAAQNNARLVELLTEHALLFHDRIMHAIGDTNAPAFEPISALAK